jgi:hypothetical protein
MQHFIFGTKERRFEKKKKKKHAKPMRKTSKTFDPFVVAQLYALPI